MTAFLCWLLLGGYKFTDYEEVVHWDNGYLLLEKFTSSTGDPGKRLLWSAEWSPSFQIAITAGSWKPKLIAVPDLLLLLEP